MKFRSRIWITEGSGSHPTRGGWIEIEYIGCSCLLIPVPPHKGWVD